MKARSRKNHAATIPTSRWLAYAGAGAATALAGATSAEAEIHYSGRVDVTFRFDESKTATFPLDQPGDFIAFERFNLRSGGHVGFKAEGLQSGFFAGSYPGFEYAYVARIHHTGLYVSQRKFTFAAGSGYHFGTMVDASEGLIKGQWKERGTSYVGFRFDNGSGKQYGWARVHMGGKNENFAYKVLDYAYADPGEPIKTGQRSSSSVNAPDEGSLGLLAVGAAGVALWRQRRKRGAA